jgi:hypothetical protein
VPLLTVQSDRRCCLQKRLTCPVPCVFNPSTSTTSSYAISIPACAAQLGYVDLAADKPPHLPELHAWRMRQPLTAFIFVGPFLCASWGGQVDQLRRAWRGGSCLPPISPRKCRAFLQYLVSYTCPCSPTWTCRPRSGQHPNRRACQSFTHGACASPSLPLFCGPLFLCVVGERVDQLRRPWRGGSCLPPISSRKCRALLPRVVYLLYVGENFGTQEATAMFFGTTELFQHRDVRNSFQRL